MRPFKDEVFRVVDVIRAIAKANGARSIHLFDRPVDVVTLDSLKPGLWPEVLRDAISIDVLADETSQMKERSPKPDCDCEN